MRSDSSNYGAGVPRVDRQGFREHFRAPGVPDSAPETPKPFIEGPWGDSPSVAHQAEQFPDTARPKGAEQYEFFQLPKDLERINAFMQRTAPSPEGCTMSWPSDVAP